MWPITSPLTKVFGVTALVLLIALGVAVKIALEAREDVGAMEGTVAAQKRELGAAAAEISAVRKQLAASNHENRQKEALLVANEARRLTLETRVTQLTRKLDKLGDQPYVPAPQLCPTDNRPVTLADFLDAPLPGDVLAWLRAALSDPRAGGQGGAGVTPGAANASVPGSSVRGDDAASGDAVHR